MLVKTETAAPKSLIFDIGHASEAAAPSSRRIPRYRSRDWGAMKSSLHHAPASTVVRSPARAILDLMPMSRARTFLAEFEAALTAVDLDAVAGMFAEECYWRDLVTFTWNIKTMEGRDQIREMLASCLAHIRPCHWQVIGGETVTKAGDVLEIWVSIRDRGRSRLRSHAHQERSNLDPADHNG